MKGYLQGTRMSQEQLYHPNGCPFMTATTLELSTHLARSSTVWGTLSFWNWAAQGIFPHQLFTHFIRLVRVPQQSSKFLFFQMCDLWFTSKLHDTLPCPGNPLTQKKLLYKRVYFSSQYESLVHHSREIMMVGEWGSCKKQKDPSPGNSAIFIHSGSSHLDEPSLFYWHTQCFLS